MRRGRRGIVGTGRIKSGIGRVDLIGSKGGMKSRGRRLHSKTEDCLM